MKRKEKDWVMAGYQCFAEHGPAGIKVELLARKLGKSKSSFYHYFPEREDFLRTMLEWHLERAKALAQEERRCNNLNPELFEVLIANQEDVLFHRQLRIHRQLPIFSDYFTAANEALDGAIALVWAKELDMENFTFPAQMVFEQVLDSFYLQLSPSTLNMNWLTAFLQEVKKMVGAVRKS